MYAWDPHITQTDAKPPELLGRISTNVAYADDPTAAANWQQWGSGAGVAANRNDAWITPPSPGSWQRTANYPDVIPQAPGITAAQWGAGKTGGYFLKRNFTLGLANPSSATDGAAWGSSQSASRWSIVGGTAGTDVTQIACAVNLFGQSDIYTIDSYNGLCYNGNFLNDPGKLFFPGGLQDLGWE
jgi:hypothetical protein